MQNKPYWLCTLCFTTVSSRNGRLNNLELPRLAVGRICIWYLLVSPIVDWDLRLFFLSLLQHAPPGTLMLMFKSMFHLLRVFAFNKNSKAMLQNYFHYLPHSLMRLRRFLHIIISLPAVCFPVKSRPQEGGNEQGDGVKA